MAGRPLTGPVSVTKTPSSVKSAPSRNGLLAAGHLGSCLLALNRSTCHMGTDAVAFWHLFWRSGPPANFGRSLGVAANERLGWHDCPVQPAGRAKGRPCSDLRRRASVLGL